jgi:hypothetical protein
MTNILTTASSARLLLGIGLMLWVVVAALLSALPEGVFR